MADSKNDVFPPTVPKTNPPHTPNTPRTPADGDKDGVVKDGTTAEHPSGIGGGTQGL